MISELRWSVNWGLCGFLQKSPSVFALWQPRCVSPPAGGRALSCPLPGVAVAGRALCWHMGTAVLAECPTLGASKPLGLPKYQTKEMKYAPGGSVWAPRREDSKGCAGPIPWHRDVPVTAHPLPQPTPIQTLQGIPHRGGVEQGCGRGY